MDLSRFRVPPGWRCQVHERCSRLVRGAALLARLVADETELI